MKNNFIFHIIVIMSQYIYNQLYQKIDSGIYSVNDLYVRKKENTNLLNSTKNSPY